MTEQEFAKFAMAMKTFYSRENILPNQQAMKLWYEQLKDIPYDVISLFLKTWVDSEKWSPAICDIRNGVAILMQGEIGDWGNGWAQVEKAIRNFGSYRIEEAYASMDDLTREVAQRLGFKNLCMSDNIQADRANFRMLYEQLAERKKRDRQISPDTKRLMGKVNTLLIADEHAFK